MTIVFIPVLQQYAIKRAELYIAFFNCHSDALDAFLSIGG